MTTKMLEIVFAELLRLEIGAAAEDLAQTYADGGRASGERVKRLTIATADAYREATHAVAHLSAEQSKQ